MAIGLYRTIFLRYKVARFFNRKNLIRLCSILQLLKALRKGVSTSRCQIFKLILAKVIKIYPITLSNPVQRILTGICLTLLIYFVITRDNSLLFTMFLILDCQSGSI